MDLYKKYSFKLSHLVYTEHKDVLENMVMLHRVLFELYQTYKDFIEEFPKYENKLDMVKSLFESLNNLHYNEQPWCELKMNSQEIGFEEMIEIVASLLVFDDLIHELIKKFDSNQLAVNFFAPNLLPLIQDLKESYQFFKIKITF